MSAAPSHTRRAVRWGIPDVVWVWFVGLVAAALAATVTSAVRGRDAGVDLDGIDLAAGLLAQNAAIVLGLAFVSRAKGLGSLQRDFGLVVRARDWPWLAAGVLVQVVAFGLVQILDAVAGGLGEQAAADTVKRTTGPEVLVVVIGVALVAPVVEELLFRGLLLRALLRRTTPVWAVVVSSAAFAVVHLLDPNTATLMTPLLLLAVVSGIRAVRSGELSQSILLHAGFNLLSATVLIVW